MAARVQEWLDKGRDVRIFTARASGPDSEQAIKVVQDWTELHFGKRLPVTCMKDYGTIEIWDDRARQVRENSGILVK
jgi:hypothetical protein